MVEATLEELFKDARISSVVSKSLLYGINEICQYVGETGKPAEGIAEAFVRSLFPYFKESNTHPLETLKQPNPAYETFWKEVSMIGCYKFNELEMYALAVDESAASVFLSQLMHRLEKSEKRMFSSNFLEPVCEKIVKGDYDYKSLDEILNEKHKRSQVK